MEGGLFFDSIKRNSAKDFLALHYRTSSFFSFLCDSLVIIILWRLSSFVVVTSSSILFFLYSRFACKTTWTVPTNFSKVIRSDWFASNMYLFILAVVVPYFSNFFPYFATHNMAGTICNLLFIIILDKHKFVTRYVFYISVCMICAYIESDIVAVFYFMLNSKGSLTNLRLTALRTAAIGLTLTLSFSSSIHIIRKLIKPRESLFEGLGEKWVNICYLFSWQTFFISWNGSLNIIFSEEVNHATQTFCSWQEKLRWLHQIWIILVFRSVFDNNLPW